MEKRCINCCYNGTNSDKCKDCKSVVDLLSDIGFSPSNWSDVYDDAVKDNVNHPSHYETGKFECIDVMIETQGVEAVKGFCICNAFKYLYRHKNKNGAEDVAKAVWYLNKFLELGGEARDQ